MTFDPTHSGGGSDEPLDRARREAVDETETAGPKAKPVPTHVAIEGYEIIRELHRGGQGIVYEAVQKSTKRKVAIKLLLEGRLASSSARRRFQREITLAAGLKHPNIIAIFDSGETPDGYHFCVMDYVRGRSIREFVRKNKLPLEDTLKLFSLVCEAAHYANQKGVVHRDLKPSNILVDTDGVPRVLDFGLAKQLAGGTQSLVSMTGQVMGTLQYMSPEQTRGNPDEIDARSDVYSLGVILYELLTGEPPYPVKGKMVDVLRHITETEPELPSKVWTADSGVSRRKSGRFRIGQCPIDDELRTILLKSLSKGRERRYQSAGAVRQDIVSYLAGEPIEAKRDSSLYVLRKSLRRHRTPIAVTIAAVAFALVALFVGLRLGGQQGPALAQTGPITSLAVLPLENLSGDPDQEYFADGMTGELITALGKIKALKVISRRSVMAYKDTDKSLPEIARELNVDALLEGTVTRSGNRVRIVANLIRASTSEQLWGDSYARDLRSILAMQGEIAQAVAREIQITLTPQEKQRLASAREVDRDAYEAYLKGRLFWNKRTEDGLTKGLSFFRKAVDFDPTYALAFAGIADSYNMLGEYQFLPPQEAFPRAAAAARQALLIDENCAEAHSSLANVMFDYEWDFEGAEREFKRAIELNPNYSTARQWYAEYLNWTGQRDAALEQIRLAKKLDPISLIINVQEGAILIANRRFDQAVEQLRTTLELNPDFAPAHSQLGSAYLGKAMYDKAIAAYRRAVDLPGSSPRILASLGHAYAAAGKRDEAMQILEELKRLSKERFLSPYYFALVYVGLGRKDEAFASLEQAYDLRSHAMTYLFTSTSFDPLRSDPRFDDLLLRIGFDPDTALQGHAKLPVTQRPEDRIMLAVLPFENLGAAEDEYFADGISDEIRSRLAAVRKLGVISRSSAFQYKETVKTNRQIGSELGVNYLIDGTIRWDKRAGGAGRVRITPELIRVADDVMLWSQSYNRVIEDIFAVQSDVAGQVIKQLKITLLKPERQAIEVIPTENLAAYQAYLRGLDYAGRPDYLEEEDRSAIQMFDEAVSLDPSFALAYTELSISHSRMHHFGYDRTEERAAKAKTAVDRALELQPDLPEAHMALGWYHYWCNRDYDLALEALAIAENNLSNNSRLLSAIGSIQRRQGKLEEALDNLKRAFELSPLDADSSSNIAETYVLLRRYSDAVRWYDRSTSLAPDQVWSYEARARIHWLWHGDVEKGRKVLEEKPSKNTPRSIFFWFKQDLFEGRYQAALDRLAVMPHESIELQYWFVPKSRLAGLVHRLMGESQRSHEAFDAAREVLEAEVKKRPNDHRVRSSLGIVYAELGHKGDAIREGIRGVELFPASKDALVGPYRVEDLALIYTLVGEHDLALDRIEYLLSIPSETMSVPMLRLDPRWDPLREHPRYRDLMRRHGFEPDPKPQTIDPPEARQTDDSTDSGG